jgi:ankyrin repeat protein
LSIAQLLINHGVTINNEPQEIPSVILIATKKGNLDMIKLLIRHGASLQDDDGKIGPNAVMQAVADQNLEILKVSLMNTILHHSL